MQNHIAKNVRVAIERCRKHLHLMCSDCMAIFLLISSSRRCCSRCHSLAVFKVFSAFPLIAWRLLHFKEIAERKFTDQMNYRFTNDQIFEEKKTYLKSASNKSYEFCSLVKFASVAVMFAAFAAISCSSWSCAFLKSANLYWYIWWCTE